MLHWFEKNRTSRFRVLSWYRPPEGTPKLFVHQNFPSSVYCWKLPLWQPYINTWFWQSLYVHGSQHLALDSELKYLMKSCVNIQVMDIGNSLYSYIKSILPTNNLEYFHLSFHLNLCEVIKPILLTNTIIPLIILEISPKDCLKCFFDVQYYFLFWLMRKFKIIKFLLKRQS